MKTILIVDDEMSLKEILGRRLEKLGFNVLKANAGQLAIILYSLKFKDIGCIFVDMTMPGMSGVECIHHLLEINSNAKIIISSGLPVNNYKEIGAVAQLYKPYTYDELKNVLNIVFKSEIL